MLRAVPPMFDSQFPGVIVMGAAVVILFFLPWIDRSPVKSIRYRGNSYKFSLAVFIVSFIFLGWLGTQPVTVIKTDLARVFTALYFAFFVALWFLPKFEKTKPVPERVTTK
jgi:ubiquinol-cytochrome c reductase cytochrome b subunit